MLTTIAFIAGYGIGLSLLGWMVYSVVREIGPTTAAAKSVAAAAQKLAAEGKEVADDFSGIFQNIQVLSAGIQDLTLAGKDVAQQISTTAATLGPVISGVKTIRNLDFQQLFHRNDSPKKFGRILQRLSGPAQTAIEKISTWFSESKDKVQDQFKKKRTPKKRWVEFVPFFAGSAVGATLIFFLRSIRRPRFDWDYSFEDDVPPALPASFENSGEA